MDTSGFYMCDGSSVYYGPNFVVNANFSLYRDQHVTYTYPVSGWYWFDSQEAALAFFGLPADTPVI